jgi:hypothetical protein
MHENLLLLESYVTSDTLLKPEIIGENPRIVVDIYDDRIVLKIGARDFCWEKGNPDCIGSGFSLTENEQG